MQHVKSLRAKVKVILYTGNILKFSFKIHILFPYSVNLLGNLNIKFTKQKQREGDEEHLWIQA